MSIQSELMSLEDIVEQGKEGRPWRFCVPIYQRLYVWGDDQVKTLLEDLFKAFQRDDEEYFLGNVLLMERDRADHLEYRRFELIDGQQRFTTLWLIAQRWGGALEPFVSVSSKNGDVPRLNFAIRDSVNKFLHDLMSKRQSIYTVIEQRNDNLAKALTHIENVEQARSTEESQHVATKEQLAAFVYNRVKLVITTVPDETDLNKLFEVINNRGVQLQHHEVLKARLLARLDANERGAYAQMWDACADMDHYIEHSFGAATGKPAHEIGALFENGELHDGKQIADSLSNKQDNPHLAFSLEQALTQEVEKAQDKDPAPSDAQEATKIESIFGFSLFLQHALRVWLHLRKHDDLPRLLDMQLLSLFERSALKDNGEEDNGERVRSFLQLLFRLRVLFDQYVIKWVDRGEERVHLIAAVSFATKGDRRYISRSNGADSDRALSLLQSMLYHSQEITTQYWVTPLLLFLHKMPAHAPRAPDLEQIFQWLRHLDNHMLGSEISGTLVERSWAFMHQPWRQQKPVHSVALAKALGLGFAHYWFYKLEFVLWHQKSHEHRRWQDFRFTAKNSIEHVSPQTPQTPQRTDPNRIDDKRVRDSFGNLALVSRGINSEYGNLPFNEKRSKFLNRDSPESLKLDLIYEHDHWGEDFARAHQAEMIKILDDYWYQTPRNQTGN